jgi:hypothetical protein
MSYVTHCGRWPCMWPDCTCRPGNQSPGWQPLPAPPLPYQNFPPFDQRPRGCICPPGSEETCKGSDCPRQPAKTYTPEPKA